MAHSGTFSSGSFAQTMVLTDIAMGWTECVPVRTRESGLVIAAIKQARSQFPFPLLGVDFDNDSALMNELVVCWCRSGIGGDAFARLSKERLSLRRAEERYYAMLDEPAMAA